MKPSGGLLLLLALGACTVQSSAAPEKHPVVAAAPAAEVEVVRNGDRWTAEFRFPRAAPIWVFARSDRARIRNRPWRPESWTILTPGVRLERRGWYDVFVAEKGNVPERVRIRFKPFADDIETGYDAALVFTDGSVALFDQQFKAFPMASAEEVEKLPIDLGGVAAAGPPTRVTFRDAGGRVLHEGRRLTSVTLDDAGTYVLFGPARPIDTEAMATIIDPKLPAWLRGFLARHTPEILGAFRATLGPAPGAKPTVMVSWAGSTPGRTSMSGSVLPGLVVMTFDGEGLLEEKPAIRNQARWFIAHESAHFWLGQAVSYEFSRDAWITEGGADLLAVRAVAAIDPSYDARAELQRALDDCLKLSAGRGVASAQERSEHRAYYACGAIFGLIAESASKKTFAHWVRPLIDANRADGILSRGEWLAALDSSSGDPSLSRDIRRLLDGGAADPKAALASLFKRAGVGYRLSQDGALTLL